jgi:hypothetical protein
LLSAPVDVPPRRGKIFGERFVCMDLDCVIGGPLDPLFDRQKIWCCSRAPVRIAPYNGSMMLIRAGCRPQVYEEVQPGWRDASGASSSVRIRHGSRTSSAGTKRPGTS